MIQILSLILFAGFVNSQSLIFTNPILGDDSSNPSILKLGGHYFLTLSTGPEIVIYRSPILTNFRNVEKKVVYRMPDGFKEIEVSEITEVNGELYIYFNMNTPSVSRRLYVIKADNPWDPLSNWGEAIRLLNDWGYTSFDGTVMKHSQQLFFVWTSPAPSHPYSLYIAPMINATLIGAPKVLLRQPKESWECHEIGLGCVSEGASFIYNKNVSYLIYSTSAWGSPDYCLSQMSIREGLDPLNVSNWQSVNEPVFWRNDEEDVYATGRAEFTTSPDGTETWMVHHATISPEHLNGRRIARLEKIEWNEDGSPIFPRPRGNYHSIPVPSGQISV